MSNILRAATAALCLFVISRVSGATAAEVKVLAVSAVSNALNELIPPFERETGHKLVVQYQATPALLKQIETGETFDLAILVASALNDPATQGFFKAARTPVASVGIGAAVRVGAPKPDLRSAASFKQALLDAKSVAILPDSVSGKHVLGVFDSLGIGEPMKAKIKAQKATGDVAQAVAKGEAELALFVATLLVGVPGVDYAGPLPAEFQQSLVLTAVLGAKAKEPEAANALVRHLTTPPLRL